MKSFFKHMSKKVIAVVLSLVIVAGLSTTALAAFGPDRPTKVWSPTTDAFDYVTFNSFTNVGNGVGDERDFFRGVQVGRDSVWADPVQNVNQDAEVEAKIYIHNGANPRLNDQPGQPGVAQNVTVRVDVPTGAKQSQEAKAFISADNAQPGTVFDTLTMTGANSGFFELAYEPGTAVIREQDGTATPLTSAQEQALTSNGLNIGNVKGCFEFVKEITFRMKVKMPRHTIDKQVALPGQTANDWKEEVTVKQGNTVSWLITFKNTGRTELERVKIVDEVPVGLTVVPGTVKLTNGNYPNGYIYPDSAIQANGRQVNVDIGNYNPDGVAYVSYRTTVDKQTQLLCQAKVLVNKAFATPEGYGAVWDVANANVAADTCQEQPQQPTTTLPVTGAGDVAGIFTGTSLVGAFLHRKWTLRRLNKH